MNSCTTSKATRLRSLSISISNRGFHRVQTCFLQPTRRDNQNPGRNAAAEQSTSQRLEQCHPTAVTVLPLYQSERVKFLVGCRLRWRNWRLANIIQQHVPSNTKPAKIKPLKL